MHLKCLTFILFITVFISCADAPDKLSYNGCQLATNSKLDMEFVRQNAARIIKSSEDNCVLLLLDTLTVRIIRSDAREYLEGLASFSEISDGYVSEYFMEIGTKLFYQDFKIFFIYIYDKYSAKKSNPLERVMIEAVSMQLSDADSPKEMQKEIDDHIESEIRKNNFTKDQLTYLATVRKKFDPDLFD